jgi:hypothetical protein
VLLTLASLVRQNGFVAPVFGAAVLAAISFIQTPAASSRKAALLRSIAYAGIALVLVAVVSGAATIAFSANSDGASENANQLRRLQIYDLAGAVRADPKLDLSILHSDDPAAEAFIHGDAAASYNTLTADNLETLPGATVLLKPDSGAIGRQWRALIFAHPLLYAQVRTGVFLPTLLTPTEAQCPVITVGVDTNTDADVVQDSGLSHRFNKRDQWDRAYEVRFFGTPFLSHLFFGAVLLVMLGIAVRDLIRRDRRPEVIAAVGMGAAALAYTASFFVVSSACDYRYLYFLDVAAMAAMVRQAAAGSPSFRKTQTP